MVDDSPQRALLDGDVGVSQRLGERCSGGSVVKPPHPLQALPEPRPERNVHLPEVRRQPRRAGENQQKRRIGANLLAGVQQRAANVDREGVRFVQQHRQRLLAATGRQRRHEIPVRRAFGLPLGRGDGGHADLAWQPSCNAPLGRKRIRLNQPLSRVWW